MNFKYKKYQENGYQSVSKQPTIYVSGASKYSSDELKQYLALQLGLPISSIRTARISNYLNYTLDKIVKYS